MDRSAATTINPFGTHMDAPSEHTASLLKPIHEAGKGAMAMKPFGGGQNATPKERRKSLQWILGLGDIDSLTIGITSPQEIDQVLDLIEDVRNGKRHYGALDRQPDNRSAGQR